MNQSNKLSDFMRRYDNIATATMKFSNEFNEAVTVYSNTIRQKKKIKINLSSHTERSFFNCTNVNILCAHRSDKTFEKKKQQKNHNKEIIIFAPVFVVNTSRCSAAKN